MTQELISVIEPIRKGYVDGFEAWLDGQASSFPEGSGERIYQIQAQTNFARKLCRVDFALAKGDNAERLDYSPKSMLGFQPMEGEVDGVLVQLQPFRWDNAVVEISGAIWDQDRVIAWFNKWFGFNGNTPAVTPRNKPVAELLPIAAASGATQLSLRDSSQLSARPGAGHVIG
jgi:hypothetical protein